MAKLATKVEFTEKTLTIFGPRGAAMIDLPVLDGVSAPVAQEACSRAARATGVGLWEVMGLWGKACDMRAEARMDKICRESRWGC